MSSDLDALVEQKVGERLKAIEKDKSDSDSALRFVLALAGAGAGWWLGTKFGAHGDNLYWAMGIGAFLGGLYEIIGFGFFLILVASLVKCMS